MLQTLNQVRHKPLIIFLSIIAFILLIVSIIPKAKPSPPPSGPPLPATPPTTDQPNQFQSLVQPRSTVSASPPSPIQDLSTSNKASLIANLPIFTPDYSIQYNENYDTFYIFIFGQEDQTLKQQVLADLNQLIPNPQDFNFQISFLGNP